MSPALSFVCSYINPGVGHADWVKTFQRIPKLVDTTLNHLGGKRIAPAGFTNAKDRDMFSDFQSWCENSFWPAARAQFGGAVTHCEPQSNGLRVKFSTPRVSTLRQDVAEAVIVESRGIVPNSPDCEERHIELQLPADMKYNTGDYLAILPHNPKEVVSRAIRRFNLTRDSHISIESATSTTLPTNSDISVWELLSSYVELGQTATKAVSANLSNLTLTFSN